MSLTVTNVYQNRRNLIVEQSDQIKEQRRKMQSQMLEKKKVQRTTKQSVKSVPTYVLGSKHIANLKKTAGLDELLAKGKEGGLGKGGRGGR